LAAIAGAAVEGISKREAENSRLVAHWHFGQRKAAHGSTHTIAGRDAQWRTINEEWKDIIRNSIFHFFFTISILFFANFSRLE
jgi:hypothetical protein